MPLFCSTFIVLTFEMFGHFVIHFPILKLTLGTKRSAEHFDFSSWKRLADADR